MNPWAILGVVVLWAASIAGTAHWFYGAGSDSELASQGREDKVAALASQAAASAAAQAISKIEVKNVQIRQPLETIVRTEQVYRDCRSSDDALRLLNSTPGIAPPVGASAPGGGQLPASSPSQ